MLDGKEFMTGDTKTAMKNIPTSIIDKVKLTTRRVTWHGSRVSTTVMSRRCSTSVPGWHGQGHHSQRRSRCRYQERYAERLFGGLFNKEARVFVMGNANNVNDMGFGGRGGFGRNRMDSTPRRWAEQCQLWKKNVIKVDGSVRWNHSDGDIFSKNSSENFVSKSASFSNSLNQSYSRSNSWTGRHASSGHPTR